MLRKLSIRKSGGDSGGDFYVAGVSLCFALGQGERAVPFPATPSLSFARAMVQGVAPLHRARLRPHLSLSLSLPPEVFSG